MSYDRKPLRIGGIVFEVITMTKDSSAGLCEGVVKAIEV
jgi:hypothetical protein